MRSRRSASLTRLLRKLPCRLELLLADWNGIPVMPGALGGEIANDGYQFTIQADMAEITSYYETELSRLGFELELTVDANAGYAILNFRQADTTGMVVIAPLGGGLNGIAIAISK